MDLWSGLGKATSRRKLGRHKFGVACLVMAYVMSNWQRQHAISIAGPMDIGWKGTAPPPEILRRLSLRFQKIPDETGIVNLNSEPAGFRLAMFVVRHSDMTAVDAT